MTIVFVCKRYYTGKDVIGHRFGRLYEFPAQLAASGHQVTVLCLDYRNYASHEYVTEQIGAGSVRWIIICVRNLFGLKVGAVYRAIKAAQPEVIIGSSDIPCLWLTRFLARIFGIAYAVDLYDNYESFGQARLPGFRHMLRISIRDAGTVIVVSPALKAKIIDDYAVSGSVIVMTNGIVSTSFSPGERLSAREFLGLPLDAKLIGTAGTLSKMKGLDTVYNAWSTIEKSREDVFLVLAGRVEPGFPIPSGPRVVYLGELLETEVGQLFRALDVGIIPAHDSAFGRYCFPQKLFEMVACGLPVVGADVGSISEALRTNAETLYTPGDENSLAIAVMFQLESSLLADVEPLEWDVLVDSFRPSLLRLVEQTRPN